MFSKALFRQMVNQTRGVASSKSVSVRSFFKVVGQQQRAANMMVMSQRAFASNTAAIEKSI
jgi:alpha-D-ribose 1-methylphosphonate 5-triphosphate synthase subunit PhnI